MHLIGASVGVATNRDDAKTMARAAMQVSRRPPARPLSIQVSRLRPGDDEPLPSWVRAPVAVLLVSDPEAASSASLEALQTLYRLTPAEARLTVALVTGEHVEEYAARQGIARSTATTHLKRVMGKMGARRQSDIVRALVNNPVVQQSSTTRVGPGGWPVARRNDVMHTPFEGR
jgi:DNA-binding CsgD family transcriptional regulator